MSIVPTIQKRTKSTTRLETLKSPQFECDSYGWGEPRLLLRLPESATLNRQRSDFTAARIYNSARSRFRGGGAAQIEWRARLTGKRCPRATSNSAVDLFYTPTAGGSQATSLNPIPARGPRGQRSKENEKGTKRERLRLQTFRARARLSNPPK